MVTDITSGANCCHGSVGRLACFLGCCLICCNCRLLFYIFARRTARMVMPLNTTWLMRWVQSLMATLLHPIWHVAFSSLGVRPARRQCVLRGRRQGGTRLRRRVITVLGLSLFICPLCSDRPLR